MKASLANYNQARLIRRGGTILLAPAVRRRRGRKSCLLLAALVIADPILNQISTAYGFTVGSLSLLQLARGVVLITTLCMAVMLPPSRTRVRRLVLRITLAIGAGVTLIALNDVLSYGFEISNIIAYVQIAYWLTIWYLAVGVITDPQRAMIVANGLVIGALITAASVFYGYLSGAAIESIYEAKGVEASAGWFVSAKGIAGSLVAGALLAAYQGYRRRPAVSVLLALFCMGASFLTYARSGLVALCVALTWLLIWSMGSRFNQRSSWAWRLLLTSFCGAIIIAASIGTADLAARWADLSDPEKAGSGRLLLWAAGARGLVNGSLSEQLFGRGFQGMLDMVYASLGVAIHTHNDLLDMLVIGGVLGLIVLGLIFAGLVIQVRAAKPASPEFAVGVAILLVLGSQAFLTGQMFLPDVMTFYLLAITAVLAGARQSGLASQAAT
ncbi:MAG: O-antigen ligase family protein [Bryobacteraceae bacterium]